MRAVRRRALPVRRPRGRDPLDPHAGPRAAGRPDPGRIAGRRHDHPSDATPIRTERGPRQAMTDGPTRARSATAEDGGGRNRERPPAPEPLPHPVVDNHCHLDIADGEDWFADRRGDRRRRCGRRDPDRADRLRPARRPLGGRGRGVVRRAGGRRSPCTPTRRRARPPPAPSTTPWRRSRRWPGRTTRSGRWGRPGSTTTARARTAGPRRWSPSAATSTSRSGSTRPWSSTTATPTTRCWPCSTSEGAPDRWVMHCFSGDADVRQGLPRPRRLPQLRRHRHVQERPAAARRARGHPPGPGAGRDRRAVPHADALPRPPQRVVPRAAHDAG